VHDLGDSVSTKQKPASTHGSGRIRVMQLEGKNGEPYVMIDGIEVKFRAKVERWLLSKTLFIRIEEDGWNNALSRAVGNKESSHFLMSVSEGSPANKPSVKVDVTVNKTTGLLEGMESALNRIYNDTFLQRMLRKKGRSAIGVGVLRTDAAS